MLIPLILLLHESSCYTPVLLLFSSQALSHFILCFSDNPTYWRKGDQSVFTGMKTTQRILVVYTESKLQCVWDVIWLTYIHILTPAQEEWKENVRDWLAGPGLLVAGEVIAASWEKLLFPSPWHLWGCIWSAESSFGLPSTRQTWTYWRESSVGSPSWSGAWTTQCAKRGWGRRICSA